MPAVSEAIDVSPGYVSHMKTGRKAIGGDYARQIEKLLKLPAYWLDGDMAPGVQEPKAMYHGVMVTRTGLLFAAEWEKLDIADRADIENEVLKRVAAKKVAKLKSSRGKNVDEQ